MAQEGQSTADIACVRGYLTGVAKYLAGKLYGPTGPVWGTSLTQIEDVLSAIQQQLAADFFALALDLQARQLPQAPPAFHACPSCQRHLEAPDTQPRYLRTAVGLAVWSEPQAYCSKCRRAFFPQSRALGIDQSELSPSLLKKVTSFGTRCRSFAEAHDSLLDGPGLDVSAKQIELLVHKLGQERVDERDALVGHFAALPLAEKFAVPDGVTAPDLATVMVDGGRLQVRTHFNQPGAATSDAAADRATAGSAGAAEDSEDSEADEPDGPEGQKKHWREDKIGLLMSMDSEPSASDPCPEIPPAFLDFQRVSELARQIHKQPRQGAEALSASDAPEAEALALEENSTYEPPAVQQKRVVASRLRWPTFALVVAATAWSLGFHGARRKAFVGDGSDNNWAIHRRFFGSFVAILDFIHVLSYVFAAAQAGQTQEVGQEVYRRWIRWVWQGKVRKVIKELTRRQKEVGKPEAGDGETHARVVVATTLGYLWNHRGKMKYAEYRQEGLPITSSLVESTVKQINQRVKGTEKFWTESGAEAILQLRADQLSAGGLEGFWQRRQTAATGQRRYRSAKRPSRKPKFSRVPTFSGAPAK
jgi:hypothetical protein